MTRSTSLNLVRATISSLLLSAALTANAQYRTSIQGAVTDPTGAVIPNATLTLRDIANNNTLVHKSDSAGVFNFNALPADRFSLTVESAGFQKKVLDNLQLIPEQPNSVNVTLDIGQNDTTVTVNAEATASLDTETSNVGGTITANDINHLPSFNRDVFTLTQLAPGTVSDGSQGAGGGVYNTPGNQGPGGSGSGGNPPTENGPQSNANGGQYETNSISIDGISTVSAVWGGTTVITPTEESIENVRIVTNDYDAENGRFSGAQTLVTSKSGTNQIHGSAFFALHRPGLNAYQRYSGGNTPVRDTQRFNQYGGSIGGPILKDRIFAFFAYESTPNKSTGTSQGWYDTPAFDALAPANSVASKFVNFPGSALNSPKLITLNEDCNSVGLMEGVNCATIPGAGLNIGSPLKQPLGTQDLTATNNAAMRGIGGGLSNVADIGYYETSSPTSAYYTQYNGRLDADATKKDHFSFAIYWVPQGNTGYNGGARAYDLFHHSQINDAFAVIYNHTFSPTFLNEARANAAGWRWNEVASNPQSPVGLPADSIDNLGNIGINQFGSNLGSDLNQWTYTYKDVATKIVGSQTIKFGGELTRLYYLNYPIYSYRPSYSFYNVWDFLNDAPAQESGAFNPLTGGIGGTREDDRENFFGAFVQDDWKARPNLTLHAGIRYSYFGPLSTKQNDVGVVHLGSGAAEFTGLSVKTGGGVWKAQKGNVGPQFGFNWSPEAFKEKLVVRGGYGLTFNQDEIAITANGGGNPPGTNYANFQFTSPSNPGSNGADIIYGISSSPTNLGGFAPNPNAITTFNTAGLPTAGNAQITAYDPNLKTQYAHHYSLDTEYELPYNLVASIGYEGSSSQHLITQYQGNATAIATGAPLNPLVTSVDYYSNNGAANNNALLAELKHTFSHHYSADAQFMWSKSMDNGSGPYEEGPYPDATNYNYGRSDFNVGKSFKLFGLWQPVLFHGSKDSWIEKIAGGYSFSGIMNLHTGFPWTAYYGTPYSLYCQNCGYYNVLPKYLGGAKKNPSNSQFEAQTTSGASTFPNYSAAVAASSTNTATVNGSSAPVPVSYFNQFFSVPNYTAAITGANFPGVNAALPPIPGSDRNSFNGPGYRDVDVSVTKGFGLPNNRILGEQARLEIRGDAFNLFNLLNLNTGAVNNNIVLPSFGRDTSALGARTVSVQARFSF